MIRGGGGRIIYLSSVMGAQPGLGGAPYGGSKAAINILANGVHQELADDGIQTVALAPGLTDTPGMRAIVGEEYIARVAASTRRAGRPARGHRGADRVPVQRRGQPPVWHRAHGPPAGLPLGTRHASNCPGRHHRRRRSPGPPGRVGDHPRGRREDLDRPEHRRQEVDASSPVGYRALIRREVGKLTGRRAGVSAPRPDG
jgi:hypothetical protein